LGGKISISGQWLSGHRSRSDWSSNDVDGNTPWVVWIWEIVSLRLNLNADSVGSELSSSWSPGERSELRVIIASIANASVSSIAFNLVGDDRSSWSSRE